MTGPSTIDISLTSIKAYSITLNWAKILFRLLLNHTYDAMISGSGNTYRDLFYLQSILDE